MRILFAEDDRDLSTAVRTLLERSGYLVDAVHDGAEAVEYAETEEYDGMILDWMMPEKDGVEALREMRQKGIRTPCLLLTARDAVEDRVTGLDAPTIIWPSPSTERNCWPGSGRCCAGGKPMCPT